VRFAKRAWAERGIWQQRFWEHLIRDDADDARHVEYCHINPLKHGLVERVRDWPHSSFHRDVGAGVFPALIGAAISKRSVSLVSRGIGEANFTRDCRLEWRMTPSAFALRATADKSAPIRPTNSIRVTRCGHDLDKHLTG